MRTRPIRALSLPVAVAAIATLAVTTLPAAAAAATTAAVREPVPRAAPADHAPYIVTVRRDLDPAAVAGLVGATPVHVYRTALHGFAARLSPTQVIALHAMPGVESISEDGQVTGSGAS